MSRVKPILFNTEMVRAILDGRKTVTRRVIKRNVDAVLNSPYHKEHPETLDKMIIEKLCMPPYRSGDILYVRETWCWEPCWDCGMDTEEHNCCDESAKKFFNHDKGEWGCYGYKASLGDDAYPSVDTWHPSIHMPKAAARIWLKVTDVRVEKLQEIDGQGVLKEGLNSYVHPKADYFDMNQRELYEKLWNFTIKKADIDRYGWEANPWVWVIEFERCEKPERSVRL